jgi:hypothetical protein
MDGGAAAHRRLGATRYYNVGDSFFDMVRCKCDSVETNIVSPNVRTKLFPGQDSKMLYHSVATGNVISKQQLLTIKQGKCNKITNIMLTETLPDNSKIVIAKPVSELGVRCHQFPTNIAKSHKRQNIN